MTREEFIKQLDAKSYEWREEGEWIIVEGKGPISLRYLGSIPSNVKFNNGGDIDLLNLVSIPDNVEFNNRGWIFLNSVKSIPDNVKFNNGLYPILDSFKSIPVNLDLEEIFKNVEDLKIGGIWLDLNQNISFPYSRWTSVDGRVKMYESWVKNNY